MGEVTNVMEFEAIAKQKLPKMVYDYYASGAEDQWTLAENRNAFSRILFRPRILIDVSKIDLSTSVLGFNISMPIMIAPTAMQKMAHPDGEYAIARAASAAGTIMTLSSWGTSSVEEVNSTGPGTRFFQLYVYKDRNVTIQLVRRAERAGFKAIALTVDTPRLGRREADIKNRFNLPPHLSLKNFEGLDIGKLNKAEDSGLASYVAGQVDRSLSWKDVQWLQSITSLPILVKGVLTAEDAKIAVQSGAAGIIVSNHGARQLDYVPATIMALEEVVKAVQGRIPVFLDGGVRRGTDVFKALALGASGVFIGRPIIWSLAADGEAGVKKALQMIRDEFELTMALSGCRSPPMKIEASAEDTHDLAVSGDDRKDFSKIADVVDGENMEKINLDQSSADDSMEEDVVETKHVDFDHISKKENDKTDEFITGMTEEPKVRPSGSSDAMQLDIPSEKVASPQETKDKSVAFSEKRKFQDEAGGGSKEPAKRQRRWNTEKTAEPQNSSIALTKKVVQPTPIKPILGRTNSTVGGDSPKERFVPKSSKTATTSLKIENFLRPFTLKAVQELLARTGEVCSFWMDQIKTHCYVTYSSVEEATETRNAVYNLQWPPNGGRLLVADFVDPQQVQTKIEGREPASPPKVTSPAVPASSFVQTPPAQQQGRKQQAELEHSLTRQPPPTPPSAPPTKEMLPSPVADKNDPPIVTLDDLFRKTKATPRIYYLPLTDEEVAKKLAIRGNAKP